MASRMQRRRTRPDSYLWSQSIWILCCLFASLLTSIGSAQGSHELTLARALFEEGVTLADQGDWAGAADRFERAHTLKPTSGIAFNWASALSAIGKLTQASELLEGVIRDPKATPELKQESEKKLAAIAPRRAKLKLHVDPNLPEHTEVSVDGDPWPRAVWGVAMPVDPGPHEATCSHEGRQLCHGSVSLNEGELKELSLVSASRGPMEMETTSSDPAPDDKPAPRRPLYKNWILWTAVGVAVVAGVVVVSLTARGDSKTESPVAGNTEPGVIRW